MKKLLLGILISLAILACQQNKSENSMSKIATKKEVEKSKFKVGILTCLTGDLGEYGVAIKNSLLLAIDQHKDLFTNIEFIFEDHIYDGKKAISAYQKLKNHDKVNLIFNWGDGPSDALAPILEKDRQASLLAYSEDNFTVSSKYLIQVGNSAKNLSSPLIDYLKEKKFQNILIIYNPFSYFERINNHLKDASIKFESLEFPMGSDFNIIIPNIKNKNYDAIGLFLTENDAIQFYKNALKFNLNSAYFGSDIFDSSKFIKNLPNNSENTVYFTVPHKYGNDYQLGFSSQVYDLAMLIGKVFNNINIQNLTQEEIVDLILTYPNGMGAGGEYIVDSKSRKISYGSVLKIIKNSKINDFIK